MGCVVPGEEKVVIINLQLYIWPGGSSIATGTSLRPGRRIFESWKKEGFCSIPQSVQKSCWSPPSLLSSGYWGLWGSARAWSWPLTFIYCRYSNSWSCTSTPQMPGA